MASRFRYSTFFRRQLLLVFLVSGSFNCLFAQNTIFSPSSTPAVPLTSDAGQAIEVGIKFRASQAGTVTALRFYKGAGNTGTHTGHLWSRTGTLLSTAIFTGESSSGWQQINLPSPITLTANTTYVASYFSSNGFYAENNSFFTANIINGPLEGLAYGDDGPNGVFLISPTSVFPTNSFQASNYWVDVVFTPSDITPPLVTSVAPINGALNIGTGTTVSAIFNEALNASTVNSTNFELRNALGVLVPSTVTYNAGTFTATLTPSAALSNTTTYTATIKGGSSGVKDAVGNALAADYSWSFTVVPSAPTNGPGGPILVISNPSNPFSRYTVEILRAEGLNEFTAVDISTITAAGSLSNYDVVILGETTVSGAQATLLSNWVTAGGTLIVFRPQGTNLNTLLGLNSVSGSLTDKYLLVNTTPGPGLGIVSQTMQFHGTADVRTLNGATSLATLYSAASTATTNPAITIRTQGGNGGRAIAFMYDLAKSIIYTRQGNPAWAGTKRDGQSGPIRSDDMFFGLPPNTGADWIDFNKIAIPQADEQQRLLANIILQGNLHRKPLPRFWYLPRGLKAAIVMTGDDHGVNGTAGRFDQ
jgi:hypothetical protein